MPFISKITRASGEAALQCVTESKTSCASSNCPRACKEILRGLAPAHAITGFLLVLLSTALSVTLFAGREFAGAPEAKFFWIVEVSLTGIWFITSIVCVCGHFRWRSRRDRREANHEGRRTSVGPESTDGGIQLGEIGVL